MRTPVLLAAALAAGASLLTATPAAAADTETLTATCLPALPIQHSGCAAGTTYPGAPLPTDTEDTWLVGQDRWSTAVEVARYGFPEADVAVLVNGEDRHLVDALSAGPLARTLAAPVLLTAAGDLPTPTQQYLRDQGIQSVLIVGGTGAVSAAVQSQLGEAGIGSVGRVSGADRWQTSLRVAALMPRGDHAWIASGDDGHLVDALAAAGPAAGAGEPLLLVPGHGDPSAVVSALRAAGTTSTTVAGGESAVSEAVLRQLPQPVRASGTDRYWTASAVASAAGEHGVRTDDVVFGNGEDRHLVDTLAAAPLGRATLLAGMGDLGVEVAENYFDAYPPVRTISVGP
ncbi:cell wall-binding repeat-containing protein [Kineococcus sp. G2]|uniref:cell wall-binding repeat-containing protein n=1 Tax=Kineococcus sp. G2 TaxID=3127484 RepID=UPI00301DC615